AIERAVIRARTRLRPLPESASGEYPGLVLLMQVIERRLGSSLNDAALKVRELADELTRTVAIADGLMRRVQLGSDREAVKGWSREVREYARATLRTETLVSKLHDQVGRGEAIIRLLGDFSVDASPTRTDAESLLQQLAEFLRL